LFDDDTVETTDVKSAVEVERDEFGLVSLSLRVDEFLDASSVETT
jgi:hypothetical protein